MNKVFKQSKKPAPGQAPKQLSRDMVGKLQGRGPHKDALFYKEHSPSKDNFLTSYRYSLIDSH